MTCVIGYKTDAGIWIGADSAGSNEYGQQALRADTKVFQVGPMLFGFCGSFRMGQLLRYELVIPPQPEGMDDFEFMVRGLISNVRDVLAGGGYTHIDKNVETGGYFIVAYKGELYSIEDDFQVGLDTRPYVCIGSGEDLAYGAMSVLHESPMGYTPQWIIRRALKAAAESNAFVAPPFVIKKHRP